MLIISFDIEIKDRPAFDTTCSNTVDTTIIFIQSRYNPQKNSDLKSEFNMI